MHRQTLLDLLAQHQTRFMEEAAFITRARAYITNQPECFNRELWPAHVTGSTWVVNYDRSKVLVLHHRKHDQWFQPGGHADGDSDILRVALRETTEETGLDPAQIHLVDSRIFDVDIHTIPAIGHDPQHEHIDIRFLVEIDDHLSIPGNDESHEIRWASLSEVSRFNNNRSTYRMVEKTRRMRAQSAA
jgi:8-oxo-dGTP pyrophosphatase MutT (NUDIX family)